MLIEILFVLALTLVLLLLFVLFRLVAELKRHNPDFPDISRGLLVQQVIPNTPAEKYVLTHKQKPKCTLNRQNLVCPSDSLDASGGSTLCFIICGYCISIALHDAIEPNH